MKKLGSISISLLLMLLALIFLGQVSLPDAAASMQCYSLDTLFNSRDATAAPPRCYHFNVPPNTSYLRIKLEAVGNGKFDLYHSANQVEFLSNWNKVNKAEISGKASYVYLEPHPGTHTIAVARTDGSGRFRLNTKAVGAASSASNQPSNSCGDGCRTMYMVTSETGGAIELGSDYGDQVIFPLEIGSSGRVEVRATWSGTADTLALILNGPDRPELPNPVAYYARKDSGSPMTLTYNITADDFLRGRKWWVRLVNFSGGRATGSVEISYPGESIRDDIEPEARLEDFAGQWQNVDANTRGITKIHIDRVGNSLNVHSWGACVPQDCDHGTNTVAFEGNPVLIGREFSFKREILTLTLLRNGELRVLSDNVFTDGTGRDYVKEYRLRLVPGTGESPWEAQHTVRFDSLPSRGQITSDVVLNGDEFQSQGIRLGAAPSGSYCHGAVAAISTPGYGAPSNYLTTALPNDPSRCDAVPVRIDFLRPVRSVSLTFVGASVVYELKAFDAQGQQLGSVQQEARLNGGVFQVTYHSDMKNIARVEFGRQAAITAVTELAYTTENVLYEENFDDGQAQGWELKEGWGTDRGMLYGQDHKWASYTAGGWRDSRVRFHLWLEEGSVIHLNYRLSEQQGRYFIGFHEHGLYLSKTAPWGTIHENLATSSVSHPPRVWHNVEIVGKGPRIQVSVDGVKELDYTDPAPLLNGTIAFETLDGAVAWLDNIVVIGPSQVQADDFVGYWQNVDADTRGITRIEIDRVGNSLRVHSWGACVPQDCDHGTITVTSQGNPVVVNRDFSFKRETLTLTLLPNGELKVVSDNVFTDGTNRDYISEYRFRR